MELVKSTAILSLVLQIVGAVFIVMGFFYKLKPEDKVLKDILIMELTVQIVEGMMYVYLIRQFTKGNIDTSLRYYDWFISTPVMLLATLLFLKYLYQKPVNTVETFKEDNLQVSWIVVLNFLMLLVGFMGEQGKLNRWVSFILGSGFLVGSFGILSEYARKTKYGQIFLSIMFGVWGFYGLAFLLPVNARNISYNFLDLFAKNFYGIFLYIVILRQYRQEKKID